jgi:hypothetical protein
VAEAVEDLDLVESLKIHARIRSLREHELQIQFDVAKRAIGTQTRRSPVRPFMMTPLAAGRPVICVGPRNFSNRTDLVVNHSLFVAGSHDFQPSRSLPFRSGFQPLFEQVRRIALRLAILHRGVADLLRVRRCDDADGCAGDRDGEGKKDGPHFGVMLP